MKFKVFIFFYLSLIPFICSSQPCLPSGITFSRQSAIDSFPISYPNCTIIEGDVLIMGNNITNLNGLININAINSSLVIENAVSLANLNGLNSLISVGNGLTLNGNSVLNYLSGLEQLTSIGDLLYIWNNPALQDLLGLENLKSIGSTLSIENNDQLTNLSGLDSLISIGTWIDIYDNDNLISLSGIDNIDPQSILYDLLIFHNANLTTCNVASICGYLENPSGGVNIHTNATGCNSPDEVKAACGINNILIFLNTSYCNIFPNPVHDVFLLSNINRELVSNVIIYNQTGQKVFSVVKPTGLINVSNLHPGIYYIEINSNNFNFKKKFIKI